MKANTILAAIFVVIGLMIFVWQVESAGVITDGLLSYWSLDEATIDGDTVQDIVGGRDATINGDPEIVAGIYGDALHFSGDYLEFDPEGLPLENEERTMCAWVNPEGAGVRAVLEWGTRTAGMRCSILVENAEKVKFCGQGADLMTVDTIPLEEWSLITETYDSTTIRIYFDGVLVQSGAININTVIEGGGKEGFGRIGCNIEVAPGEFMQGAIDEVSIYDRMLDDDEVMENFNAGPLDLAVEPASKLALTWGGIKLP